MLLRTVGFLVDIRRERSWIVAQSFESKDMTKVLMLDIQLQDSPFPVPVDNSIKWSIVYYRPVLWLQLQAKTEEFQKNVLLQR